MKKLNNNEMENLNGGLIAPGPGEAERCRAMNIADYAAANTGLGGIAPFDQFFTCFF